MKQKKILVADSSKIFLDLECGYFQKIGCQTLPASTGAQALKIAMDENPDLILLDYSLSDMKGPEFLRKLKDNFVTRNIPVIIMSADPGAEKESRNAGAVDFQQKPLKQRELIFRTSSLLNIPLRYDLNIPVSITNMEGSGKVKIQGQVLDLSESGAKIETSLNIEKNAMLALEFNKPGSTQTIRVECKVMRTEKPEDGRHYYGVRFTAIDDRAKAVLNNYLSSLSARVRI